MILHIYQIAFMALVAVTQGASVDQVATADYDAIIVGGGPAGLAAMSGLARVRRKVMLVDSGEYRNGPTRHMHDVLGFDGVTPAYYRWAAREQLSHYPSVSWKNGTITKIVPSKDGTYFTLTATHSHSAGWNITARKVVLATGLRDILPTTPGLRENWGSGIFWCPWCDGNEHADQGLGLIAPLPEIPGMVREILTLNKDIVAFVNGTDTAEARAATEEKNPGWEKYLAKHNVVVENRTVERIIRLRNGTDGTEDPSLPTVPEHDLFRVEFAPGASMERNAFFTSFGAEQTSRVGQETGILMYGNRLAVDPTKGLVTNIPGIYAIGDANSDNVTNVPHALFSGKRTAVYLHVQIAREDGTKDVEEGSDSAADKRDTHEEARSLWERINGSPDEILYAGSFDQ